MYLFYCRTVPLSLFIALSFSVLQGSLDPCILHCNHKRSGLPLTGPPDCYKVICEAVATGRRTRSRNISLSKQTSHVNGCTDPATELQWLVVIVVKLVLSNFIDKIIAVAERDPTTLAGASHISRYMITVHCK